MGSFFAGVKAGTLAGLVYLGGLAVANVGVLYALKGQVYSIIMTHFSEYCTSAPSGNSTSSIPACFNSVLSVYVPFIAFIGFFIALLYSGIFGQLYEYIPGRSPVAKGELIAIVVGVNLVFLDLSGVFFNFTSAVMTTAAFLVLTFVFGLILGRLYKKYTRTVTFQSDDSELLRIRVDRRDLTGKSRTFAATSSHKVTADLTEDASFKEWATSGGITLEDPRSFETVMEVNGDGLLKAHVSKKY